MEIIDPVTFLQNNRQRMLYVGFLKSASEEWFPLCMVSNSEEGSKLDTLFVSSSYQEMTHVVEDYAKEIPQVVQTFVLYLMPEEIENLIERYALDKMAIVLPEGDGESCGCGCDCH